MKEGLNGANSHPPPTQVQTTGALGDFQTAAGTAAQPAEGRPR